MASLRNTEKAVDTRYDSGTVRRVLARASELEQQEVETLSAPQIEALGRELGLSPDAVRRALGEVTGGYRTQISSVNTALRPLSVREMLLTPLPGVVYGACVAAFILLAPGGFSMFDLSTNSLTVFALQFLFYWLPPALALWLGWRRRDWRLGLATGVFIAYVAQYAGPTALSIKSGFSMNGEYLMTTLWGAAAGAVGGFLGKRRQEEQQRAAR